MMGGGTCSIGSKSSNRPRRRLQPAGGGRSRGKNRTHTDDQKSDSRHKHT